MNFYWKGKQPKTYRCKPDLSKPKPRFNSDNELVCPWEYHLAMMAWHATRQAYRNLLARRKNISGYQNIGVPEPNPQCTDNQGGDRVSDLHQQ